MINKQKINYRQSILFLWNILKPHKKLYFLVSFFSLVFTGLGIMQARTTQLLIDSASSRDMRNILLSLFFYILLIILNPSLRYINDLAVAKLGAYTGRDLKKKVAKKILNAEYGKIIHKKTGDMMKTVNSDTGAVCNFLSNDLNSLFSKFAMAIGILIYIIYVNPLLALITFLYTPLGMFFTLSINKKMNELYPRRAKIDGEALSVVEQIFSSIPIVKSFMAERQTRKKIYNEYTQIYETDLKVSKWNSLLQTACSSTSMIPKIIFLSFGGFLCLKGNFTIGVLISVYDLLEYVIAPTVYFPFLLNGLNQSVVSMNRIQDLLDIPFQDDIEMHNTANPHISVDHLSFSYQDGVPVIDDVSFEHTGPEIIALCGKSGSGKTTLIDLISGLYKPDKGTIRMDGVLSVVSQDVYLFADSLLNNIRVLKPDASKEQVEQAIRMAAANGFIESLPKGLETWVGDGSFDFSGGQKQRISLARTILSDAQIWLLDEPTSAMDAETEKIILQTILEASKTKLIIVSAHRDSLIKLTDRRIDL